MKACPCAWSRWILGLLLISLAVMPPTCVPFRLGPDVPAVSE